jgi:hypothetical protein
MTENNSEKRLRKNGTKEEETKKRKRNRNKSVNTVIVPQ